MGSWVNYPQNPNKGWCSAPKLWYSHLGMKMVIENPIKLILPEETDAVRKFLTFTDRSVEYQISKIRRNYRWMKSNPESCLARIAALKEQMKVCLLFHDENDRPWTYSGLWRDLQQVFHWELESQIKFPEEKLVGWNKPPEHKARYYQVEAVEALLKGRHGAVALPTGCHAKGQGVLMYDGSIKKVEDIVVGDLLMGPDSKPRTVLGLCRGRQGMIKIIPVSGDSFIVNRSHILSLKRTNTRSKYRTEEVERISTFKGINPVVNLSVEEYLIRSKTFKHTHKLYRTGVDFTVNSAPLPIPPYILGLWLGDGHSPTAALTTMDPEIEIEWNSWVTGRGMGISVSHKSGNRASTYFSIIPNKDNSWRHGARRGTRANTCNILLNDLGLLDNKHIPSQYKITTRQNRLDLLAGLLDSDGYLGSNCFEISSKFSDLADDILFIARSLGFSANRKIEQKGCQTGAVGTYHRIEISGNTDLIPNRLPRKRATPRKQLKNVLVTGFKTETLPEEDYYGFELDDDRLYLLDDFTVTHNSGKSYLITELCKRLGLKTIVMTPSASITDQLYREFLLRFGPKRVGKYGDGSKKTDKLFTICTGQALTRLEPGTKEWDDLSKALVYICDESHTVPCATFEKVCMGVAATAPYRFFVSATQMRNDGSGMVLNGIAGPIVYEKAFRDLVQQKFLAEPIVKIFHVPCAQGTCDDDVMIETRQQLYLNPHVNSLTGQITEKAVKLANRQVVILIDEFKQFLALKNYLTIPYEFVHGTPSKEEKERLPEEYWKCDVEASVKRFNDGECKVLIGTSAISTGVDLKPVGCLIYLQGGTSEIQVKQSLGRGTRVIEGLKYDFWVVDFKVMGSPKMERHLNTREEYYREFTDKVDHYG